MKHKMLMLDLNVIAWTLIIMCLIALSVLLADIYKSWLYNNAIKQQNAKDRLEREMAAAISATVNPRIYTDHEGKQILAFGLLVGIMLGVSGTISAVRLIKRRKEKNARRVQG